MTFARAIQEDRRLVILRSLNEMPDCRLNTSLIQGAVCAITASCSRDQIESDCAWLEEQGLVTREDIGGRIVVVTLTERGQDVAVGRATCPGVKRPSPGMGGGR